MFVNNKAFNGYLGLRKMYKRKVIRKLLMRAIEIVLYELIEFIS